MVFGKPLHTALAQLVRASAFYPKDVSRMSWVQTPQAVSNIFFTPHKTQTKKIDSPGHPVVSSEKMDSVFARVKRLPRKAAVEARKNMKDQAADAYDFDSDSDRSQNGWARSVNNTTVTLIPTPGFREIPTRSSSRVASRS